MSQSQSREALLELVSLLILVPPLLTRLAPSTMTYVLACVLSLIVINVFLAATRSLEYWFLSVVYGGFSLIVALFLLLEQLGLVSPGLWVWIDLILVVMLLLIVTRYYHVESLHYFASPLIPLSVLAGSILGVYMGLDSPVRYIAGGLVDAFSSIILLSTSRSKLLGLVLCIVFFMGLYTQPIFSTSSTGLLILLILHLSRNIAFVIRKLTYVKLVVIVDLVLRSIVVSVF